VTGTCPLSPSQIGQTRLTNLSWSHYECLLRVKDVDARKWYLHEAESENWSVRTLDRNISSQYYYRLLQTPDANKQEVIDEMKQKTADYQRDKLEIMKNPIVAEFLGLPQNPTFSETKLETAIIEHLKDFIMELGRGFAFVARQKHIKTDMGDYYIDLVFYNYKMRCFVLIDLKTSQITHQDVGQMDMYRRMYDAMERNEGDNPTIGLLLCAETSKDMAQYSVLHDNDQLFAAKYMTYLPKKEELMAEIEYQKRLFDLQKSKE
jgi:predicted nuclease of restriction endonuclease-like (RecB) superfamily